MPELDERAVEAAARAVLDATRLPPHARELKAAWAHETVSSALAAYFAALDREALVRVVEDAIAAPGRVRNIGADETLEAHRAKAVLAALGLFTPDTEEPT